MTVAVSCGGMGRFLFSQKEVFPTFSRAYRCIIFGVAFYSPTKPSPIITRASLTHDRIILCLFVCFCSRWECTFWTHETFLFRLCPFFRLFWGFCHGSIYRSYFSCGLSTRKQEPSRKSRYWCVSQFLVFNFLSVRYFPVIHRRNFTLFVFRRYCISSLKLKS